MRLDVRFSGTQQQSHWSDSLEAILLDALERFQRRVRYVCLYFEDVNGPKGGVDKQCRCVVHLRRMPPIVIQDEDANFVALVRRIANRAAYRLSERTKRRTQKGTRRRGGPEDMSNLDYGTYNSEATQDLAASN